MTDTITLESLDERMKRFQAALDRRERWNQEFEQAYRFMMPNRLQLTESNLRNTSSGEVNRGEARMEEIFDPTGIEALGAFANNLQTSLMPAFKQWAELVANEQMKSLSASFVERFGEISDATMDSIRLQVFEATKTVFMYFESSRLPQIIHESFIDVGISTGVLFLNEGPLDNPLQFEAVPANQVIIEGGPQQSLENFWQPMREKGRNLLLRYPKAKLSAKLQQRITRDPEGFIDIIQASLSYPQNPEGFRFYFSVIVQDDTEEIITDWRDQDPYLAFRGMKSPGEIYGRGPAFTALPFVRQLNKISEFMLRALQLQSYPVFQVADTSDINPFTLRIEPGSIIPVSPQMMQLGGAIQRLDTGPPPVMPIEYMKELRILIKDIMFANPLGPAGLPNKTATESTLINNNWIRKNSGFFSRIAVELFPQLISKSLHILTKKGIIPLLKINNESVPLRIDNRFVKLKYDNPLAALQDQEDLEAIEKALQFSVGALGPEALATFNIGELPETVYRKLKVPENIINEKFKTSVVVKNIENTLNQAPPTAPPPSAPGGGNAGIPPVPGGP